MAGVIVAVIIRDTETGDETRYDLATVPQEPPAPPADPPGPPQEPEPPPPPDVGALEADWNFTPSKLKPAQRLWHGQLLEHIGGKSYPSPNSVTDKATEKQPDGSVKTLETADVYEISRALNLYAGALEAAIRGTRDLELVEEVSRVMNQARANMTTRNGYKVWLYWHSKDVHYGHDTRAVDETLLFWMVVRVARLLEANRVHPIERYASEAAWWLDYAESMLKRWQQKNPNAPPLQALDMPLTHCFVSMAGGFLLLGELAGKDAYTQEGYRRLAVFRQMLYEGPKGGLIWPHTTPGYKGTPQPAPGIDYTSHTVEVLMTLCHEGLIDETLMQQITAGVRNHMLRSENEMAVNLDGTGATYPLKYMHNAYAGLAQWDSTGKIAQINSVLGAIGQYRNRVFIPAYELLRLVK